MTGGTSGIGGWAGLKRWPGAVCFLASGEAPFGSSLMVDGGYAAQ